MTPKQWMFNPKSGDIKIPPAVQADVEKRIQASTQGSKFVSRTNSVISMHIPSLFSPIVGRLRMGLKLAKNMQSDYVIPPSIFVAYGILAPINGALRFIHTAMINTNCPCTMMGSSSAYQNGLFSFQQMCI